MPFCRGETGSGKTHTLHSINRKLCEIAAPLAHEYGRSLLTNILRLPSILQAFGTSSNWKHNSASGFGVQAEVKADNETMLGVYRVFHMLVAGATSKERDLWGLPLQSTADGESHQVLVHQMDELRASLKALGIGGNKQARIFGMLAGIYHLVNLSDEDDHSRVLPKIALLLGLEESRIEEFPLEGF
ncbi:P-loop containing nucleoside triphosphate hydrolase protein [Chytridium lagenaria]|nr:P-loop containing nucleoside triphosphate hydrolase protein [Chytridium lagenaria]